MEIHDAIITPEVTEKFTTEITTSQNVLREKLELQISTLAQAKSPLTQREYKNACKEFLNMQWDQITNENSFSLDQVESYLGKLKQKGLRQTTITKKISALSAFFNHLLKRGLIKENFIHKLDKGEKKRGKGKKTATLKSSEVRAIFESLNPKAKNFLFHRAILGVGFYTGLRNSEITGLRFKNLIQSEGYPMIAVHIKHQKNDEPHKVVVHPELKEYLDEYFDELEKKGIDTKNPEGLLFSCNRKGYSHKKPLTAQGLDYIFKKSLIRAGIVLDDDKRYSPHSMRRTMGNNMEDKDVPLYRIQKVYGHASADTTVGYLEKEESAAKSGIWSVRY